VFQKENRQVQQPSIRFEKFYGETDFGEGLKGPSPKQILLVGFGNIPTHTDFAIVNAQIKPTIGTVAHPRFVFYRRAITPIV
jgi:hypothetical protein